MTRKPVFATTSSAVGVFDSGVGGLSVLRELRREMPAQLFVYLADTAHVPYGGRTDDDIRALTEKNVAWLRARGVGAVVVACNTASAYGLEHLRQLWPTLPIVGLEPAVKPAAERTQSGVIAVMATPATLRGSRLRELVAQYAQPRGVDVLYVSHADLVPLVESGQADSAEARALLRDLLRPAREAGADGLVLGCTHYPFLATSIRREFGSAFALIDSGAAVARHTRRLLERGGLLAPASGGDVRFFATGDPAAAGARMSALLGEQVRVEAARF